MNFVTSFTENSKPDISISVLQLIQMSRRNEGLSGISFGNINAVEGTRIHRAFYRELSEQFPEINFETERGLQGDFKKDELKIRVRGRADLFEYRGKNKVIINEVKTVGIPVSDIDPRGAAVHHAQLKSYLYLYALETLSEKIKKLNRGKTLSGSEKDISNESQIRKDFCKSVWNGALSYVSSTDLKTLRIEKSYTFSELEEFFNSMLNLYFSFALNLKYYKESRNAAIKGLRFPFKELRPGQKDFIKRVYRRLKDRTPLLAEAATGVGKTLSVIYPSVKALANSVIDKIFYLTAKTSTRIVAEKSLIQLAGTELPLRRISLTAKEKICAAPEYYCDTKLCPFANQYYARLPEALEFVLSNNAVTEKEIKAAAEKYKLCPFELSLDASEYCDIIIGDYNHAFDPRVRLSRFFNENDGHFALLVDEAHNLADRIKEMYSAELESESLLSAFRIVNDNTLFTENFDSKSYGLYFSSLLSVFEELKTLIRAGKPGIDILDGKFDPASLLAADGFRAVKQLPKDFISKIRKLSFALRPVPEEIIDLGQKRKFLEFYFELLYFLRIADESFDKNYVFTVKLEGEKLLFRLLCLDGSEKLSKTYKNKHAAVFFSATLSPFEYFSKALCGRDRNNRPDRIHLSSPFPPENLAVAFYTGIRTVYASREASLIPLAKLAANTVIRRPGRYLMFFPSYVYMEKCADLLKKIFSNPAYDVDLILQKKNMTQSEKISFLSNFNAEKGRNLLALAILGGVFGEGIDLGGDRLNGVIIVGTGLPGISPEKELQKLHFEEEGLPGFVYAYAFPGFNKVMQAAGRLIRSENDKGIIVLIDERYGRNDYISLVPEEWSPVIAASLPPYLNFLESAPDYWSSAGFPG